VTRNDRAVAGVALPTFRWCTVAPVTHASVFPCPLHATAVAAGPDSSRAAATLMTTGSPPFRGGMGALQTRSPARNATVFPSGLIRMSAKSGEPAGPVSPPTRACTCRSFPAVV
jgi:hypothetical protein